MNRTTLAAALIVMVAFTAGTEGADDWAHYLGPNFDLQPSAKAFKAQSATVAWNAHVTTGMCSLTVADGLLYTMGNDGTEENKEEARDFVYCLDAKTGKEKWTFDYPCLLEPRLHPGGPSSTPTVHEGKLYTLSKSGHIFCLDAKTGGKIWDASGQQYKPKKPWWGFAASPTIMGDVVIYNVGDRGLGLNKDTGEVVWKSDRGVVAYATPRPLPTTMFNRPAVALFTNEAFLVLNPATGQSVATYERPWQEKSNCNAITPYIHNGRIYLVQSAHGMACLSVDGNVLTQDWLAEDGKYASEWHAFNTHVIYEDHIYFLTKGRGSGTTGLCCVDAETGSRKWFEEKYGFGNLMRVDDTMIMLSEEGELIWGKLTNATFKEAYRQKILEGLCWAKPVLLGNILYARDAEGAVVSLRLE
ncbi:MAG: PQQ-like beta-propeller repeat protein [Phycisphaerales bacterium]|nr:MAG: PQQ-like beta-propeller repeat protein [Phycisphaerales bacterium]